MNKILVIYNNKFFLEFIEQYIRIYNFNVFVSMNARDGFNLSKIIIPDLIIIDKDIDDIKLDDFFLKKSMVAELKNIPIFLIGNYNPDEIENNKKENVKAYISLPVNPITLLERIQLLFNINPIKEQDSTPMFIDIHIRSNIIIIQIEGNLEKDKLEILNYNIRTICEKKKLLSPKIFFIIPSIYPETVSKENLTVLFRFIDFEELDITSQNIKMLTQHQPLIDLLYKDKEYKKFEIVTDFIDGILKLSIEEKNKKIIKIKELKENTAYMYGLYDKNDDILIPPLTLITKEIIDYLTTKHEKALIYYSDTELKPIGNIEAIKEKSDNYISEIINKYELIDEDIDIIKNLYDKIKLFFNKRKNSNILVISYNKLNNFIISDALKPYFNISFLENFGASPVPDDKKYISIFFDLDINEPGALEILKKIKTNSNFEKTPVIITSDNISNDVMKELSNQGLSDILTAPLSKKKILEKIIEKISLNNNYR